MTATATQVVLPPGGIDGTARVSPWITLLLAAACGLVAANIYYAQPVAALIAASLGMPPQGAGLIVTATQVGYGAGLLLIVPLGDLLENRRLVVGLVLGTMLALAVAAASTSAAIFLPAALSIGLCSVAVQILVPYAAHLAPEATRGRAVGNVMSGLMLGIMLARPFSSILTDVFSWHAVFVISAFLMGILAVVLRFVLPRRAPASTLGYGALLASLVRLARNTPVLRRRAFYHAWLFGAFSLFWTTVPLQLADTFHLSQTGIALFAAAGIAGALAAPIAGRIADLGWTRPATIVAMVAVAASFAVDRVGLSETHSGLACLLAGAILIDFGVTAHVVLGQREIFGLPAEIRGRLNGIYMATFFMGGAIGSGLGGWAFAYGGWSAATWIGLVMPAIPLACFLAERPIATGVPR